ncbi:pinin isoform X2 [Hydra vulgaris]|uniref:Pinin n=1 Tax=Hydra vulgaris TaxID=6087 RepID=A0ABM4CG02_HYDVU
MAADMISELQQARDALKQNIIAVDETIKKLTGRDPAEHTRSTGRRIQLKRNSYGDKFGNHQPPAKLANTERRRWGTTLNREKRLDSGGEEEEEKKPAVHSSVVVTGKPVLQSSVKEDVITKNRNRRMFGLLVGTLKQFKRESQVKTEQDSKREEKLSKVEDQVQKEKDNALIERKELYQSRRNKQLELKQLEFKLEMAKLNVELKDHYSKFKDFIQLKSTPRIFYKPATHNKKTTALLEESQKFLNESLEQRLKEIDMFTEADFLPPTRKALGKTNKDPIVISDAKPANQRDLFAEDADNEEREKDSVVDMKDDDDILEIIDKNQICDIDVIKSDAYDVDVVKSGSFDVVDERIVELADHSEESRDQVSIEE